MGEEKNCIANPGSECEGTSATIHILNTNQRSLVGFQDTLLYALVPISVLKRPRVILAYHTRQKCIEKYLRIKVLSSVINKGIRNCLAQSNLKTIRRNSYKVESENGMFCHNTKFS